MDYFRKFFDGVDFDGGGEVKVLCPFHHDHSPSATVNVENGLFYCYVCQWGGNEEQFYAKLHDISVRDASKLLSHSHTALDDWALTSKADLWADETFLTTLQKSLSLSHEIIEQLDLGLVLYKGKKFLGVPVFYNKLLVDIRRYNLLKHPDLPKMIGNEGVQNGFIVPYDLWDKTQPTYIFEGEKDMIVARECGINAITLTGGAGASPNTLVLNSFNGVEVIICYDNDKAGRDGTLSLAKKLHGHASSIEYINIGDFVQAEKEDFADYILKYHGDPVEFLSAEMHSFKDEQLVDRKKQTVTIASALRNNMLLRHLTSEVTVASEYSSLYTVPSLVKAVKLGESTGKDEMENGDERSWFLDDTNLEQSLELIEIDAKKKNIDETLKRFLNIPVKESGVALQKKDYLTIYRCSVVDKRMDGSSTNLDIYSFEKLQVGGQYIMEYTLFNHPTKNQQLVGVAHNVTPIGDSGDYIVDTAKLSQFVTQGSIKDRLNYLYQSAKHHIAKHLDYNIWLMSDLVFNSILDIDYGGKLSGALDVFFLGDTQVGKSETTSKMTELYNFGKFLSLKTSTTVGLIGGSNKVDGSWCNTIGAIPRQHKRLVVLEEFSGAKPDFIKTMTDIRTSKTLRLARASGELEVPCHLRMISISNPVNDEGGNPRFLSTFPNGVLPIMELIKSAEDVARYDAFLLVPKREKRFNPFGFELQGEPIAKECYEHKAEWVTTRKAENVLFAEGVEAYIWETGEVLNEQFECNFPVFGTTTSKKLARFSVAMASLLLNTDEHFENIIVTKEIVDCVAEFLTDIYKSEYFRLDAYKKEYDSYNNYLPEDITKLEKLYPANSVLLDFLSKQSHTSRNNLKTISGLDGDKFNPVFNQMVASRFIRINMDNVYPTEKFRKVYPKIKKSSTSTGASLIDSLTNSEERNQK